MEITKNKIKLFGYELIPDKKDMRFYCSKVSFDKYDSGYSIRVGHFIDVEEKLKKKGFVEIENKFDLEGYSLIPYKDGKYKIEYEESLRKKLSPKCKNGWHREIEFVVYDNVSWIRWGIFFKKVKSKTPACC